MDFFRLFVFVSFSSILWLSGAVGLGGDCDHDRNEPYSYKTMYACVMATVLFLYLLSSVS